MRKLLAAMLIAFAAVATPAQDTKIDDVLKGTTHPPFLKVEDLTPEFRGMRLTLAGAPASGFMSMMMPFAMMGGMNAPGSSPEMGIFTMIGLSWTKGATVTMAGREFLVTYLLEMGVQPTNREAPLAATLRLNLVRTDMIVSLAPHPDATADALKKALTDAKITLNQQGAIPIGSGEEATTAAIMVPVAAQAQRAAKSTQTLSNIKQAALAMVIYAADYDDVLPYVQSTGGVVAVTEPYSKNLSIFWTADGDRFLFNMALAGVSLTAIENPAATVLLYAEVPDEDGKRSVAFSDGSARRLDPAQWEQAQTTLRLRLPKTAKKPLPFDLGGKHNAKRPPTPQAQPTDTAVPAGAAPPPR